MPIMYILEGLPGSGKTTWRKQHNLAYVNKDELRERYPLANESDIHMKQMVIMSDFAHKRIDFCIDNTNFNPRTVASYVQWARSSGYESHKVSFSHVTVEQCIANDEQRRMRGKRYVGRDIIIGMALQYGLHNLGDIYIFDIDGTVADLTHRKHYIDSKPKDHTKFFQECYLDKPIYPVINMYHTLSRNTRCIMVSGRPEKHSDVDIRAMTRAWLNEYGIDPYVLLMRRNKDHRQDTEVKREIYNTYLKGKSNILGVFDDRDSVVKMWRDEGLTCYQCAEGNF